MHMHRLKTGEHGEVQSVSQPYGCQPFDYEARVRGKPCTTPSMSNSFGDAGRDGPDLPSSYLAFTAAKQWNPGSLK